MRGDDGGKRPAITEMWESILIKNTQNLHDYPCSKKSSTRVFHMPAYLSSLMCRGLIGPPSVRGSIKAFEEIGKGRYRRHVNDINLITRTGFRALAGW